MQHCSCGNPGRIKVMIGHRGDERQHCVVACRVCWRIVIGAMRRVWAARTVEVAA